MPEVAIIRGKQSRTFHFKDFNDQTGAHSQPPRSDPACDWRGDRVGHLSGSRRSPQTDRRTRCPGAVGMAGGLYIHIRDCFGSLPAFLFGWTLFFAISSGATATLAVGFGKALAQVIDISPELEKIVALAMILVVTIINVIGTRTSADVQNWTTA